MVKRCNEEANYSPYLVMYFCASMSGKMLDIKNKKAN